MRCKNCKKKFERDAPWHTWCSSECREVLAVKLIQKHREANERTQEKARLKRERKERVSLKKRREAIKPKSELLKEAQKAFNDYVRIRDKDFLCINTLMPVSWDGNESDAAHFVSRAANPAMRFDLRNVHKSTKASNANQEKYIHDYRENLIGRLGERRFQEFERDCKYWKTHKRTFNKEYLNRIKRIFRKKKRIKLKLIKSEG